MRDLAIIGLGELGKLFGAGALRAGVRVTPITRGSDPRALDTFVTPDTPILVAVGEDALSGLLAALPGPLRKRLVLLQNELFPSIYRAHGLAPSVLVPWLLQKRGQPTTVARPSPIYGREADLFAEIFAALALPCVKLTREAELAQALVDKYTFILTINALGLSRDRTLGSWLEEDPAQVWDMCSEAARLGEALVEAPIDAQAARAATEEAMIALAQMPARGRSAEERVRRAHVHAARLGLRLPRLERLAAAL